MVVFKYEIYCRSINYQTKLYGTIQDYSHILRHLQSNNCLMETSNYPRASQGLCDESSKIPHIQLKSKPCAIDFCLGMHFHCFFLDLKTHPGFINVHKLDNQFVISDGDGWYCTNILNYWSLLEERHKLLH